MLSKRDGIKVSPYLRDADLSNMDLRKLDLRQSYLGGANLMGTDLRDMNLSYVDFRGAYLNGANLSGADARGANFSGAILVGANLHEAYLGGTNFRNADLRETDLSKAKLISADCRNVNFSNANFSDADLYNADLRGANLGGASGLLSAKKFLEQFARDNDGAIICYKIINLNYRAPATWEIKSGSFIEEVCNPNRTNDYGCGVNVSTLDWAMRHAESHHNVWKCRILPEDFVGIVVPYNTDGTFRAERVQLIEEL